MTDDDIRLRGGLNTNKNIFSKGDILKQKLKFNKHGDIIYDEETIFEFSHLEDNLLFMKNLKSNEIIKTHYAKADKFIKI